MSMISKKYKKIVSLLQKVAMTVEPVANARVSAAIIRRSEIIAIGANRPRSHPLQAKFAKHPEAIFQHAEINCIINALSLHKHDDLEKSEIIVARVKRDGSLALAKPCIGCLAAINYYGIKKIHYTNNAGSLLTCEEC